MSVLAIFTVKGDTTDLPRRYDNAMPAIVASAPSKPLAHTCTPSDDGIRIYDVWESPQALEDFAGNPRFRQAIADAGLPEPEVHVLPVHRFNW